MYISQVMFAMLNNLLSSSACRHNYPAHTMGANPVIVYNNIDFATSVTLPGQAYTGTRPLIPYGSNN